MDPWYDVNTPLRVSLFRAKEKNKSCTLEGLGFWMTMYSHYRIFCSILARRLAGQAVGWRDGFTGFAGLGGFAGRAGWLLRWRDGCAGMDCVCFLISSWLVGSLELHHGHFIDSVVFVFFLQFHWFVWFVANGHCIAWIFKVFSNSIRAIMHACMLLYSFAYFTLVSWTL